MSYEHDRDDFGTKAKLYLEQQRKEYLGIAADFLWQIAHPSEEGDEKMEKVLLVDICSQWRGHSQELYYLWELAGGEPSVVTHIFENL